MRLQLCIAFIVLTVWMFGANAENGSSVMLSLAHLLNGSNPQNFLSSVGSTQTCPYKTPITCDTTNKFRTIDGSCNNAKSAYMGKSETPYIRNYPALYDNGKPRIKSFFGGLLPTPRKISNDLFKETSQESVALTNMAAVFARFVEHDLYKTKLSPATACCQSSSSASSCNNIVVEATDPYFGTYRRVCLPKGNALSSATIECKHGISQQINENTHYLDLSNIYGSTTTVADSLRTKTDGLLKESATGNFLPKLDLSECKLPTPNAKNIHCFLAGDSRVNNDPLLMAMYTMWVREHNYIAKEIKAITPKGTDEEIYQLARKILIAQYQHIVYNEFLVALDTNTPSKPTGSSTVSTKPQSAIANVFTITFTGIADSMVRKTYKFDAADVAMESTWFNPEKIWENLGIQKLFTGMLTEKSETIDRFIVKPIRDQYLETTPGQGTDKVSINIQQTRENGLLNYFLMNSLILKNFNIQNYAGITNLEATAKVEIEKLYPQVFDIDFLPGILSEKQATDAQYGTLIKHIVDDQFKRLKESDAFYYENNGVFEAAQLTEVKKISMGKILCRHAALTKTQESVFKLPDNTNNADQTCANVAYPNLCVWSKDGWSPWVSTPCINSIIISSRQCQFLPTGKCKCEGLPFKFEACPSNLQNIMDPLIINRFSLAYENAFDDQGHARNGSTNAADIVNELFRNVSRG